MALSHVVARGGRPRGAAASSDVRTALDAFRYIVQALRVASRDCERRVGLSGAQLFALQQVAEHRNLSINDLAARTFTHQSSVSVVIQRLVAEGLVAKVAASHDRRRQCLAATAKGRRVLRGAPVALQERLIAAIQALPRPDRRALARSLAGVARHVAPEGAPYPPMLFEDGISSGGERRAGGPAAPRLGAKTP